MAGISWYLKRLSVMRPREIVHRMLEQIRLRWMMAVYRVNGGHGPDGRLEWTEFTFCTAADAQLPDLSWRFPEEEAFVSSRLNGEAGALGYSWSWRNTQGVWHEAPDTGKQWPALFYGSIPYRSGNPYGDIRVAWEPSRLQHLIDLSWLAETTDAQKAGEAVRLLERQFLSWCEENPPWRGIHYISVMECGLRIISVAYALDRVRARLNSPGEVWGAYAGMVKVHAKLIMERLSLYSSTGNHTIAECAGLVYAGLLFPEMKASSHWLDTGLRLLEAEVDRQILPDGGSVEQALWYHLFVLDLYGLVVELLVSRQRNVPRPIENALERGRKFLAAFGDSPEALPAIGDSDSGFALSRYLRLSWQNAEEYQAGLTTFRYAGYSIIRNTTGSGLDLILDHGPLGMPPSFAHGHADALSLIMSFNGKPLLVDTGTYTYTGDTKWRAYFRSTRAHNTVLIDDLDQAVQMTPFQWSRPVGAELIKVMEGNDGSIRLLARHTGYKHLGLTHWRGILKDSSGIVWIWDFVDGAGIHQLELNWHIDTDVVDYQEGLYIVRTGSATVTIDIRGGELGHSLAATDPVSGWKSKIYGQKQPITTINCKHKGRAPHEFITRISDSERSPAALETVWLNIGADFRRWIQ